LPLNHHFGWPFLSFLVSQIGRFHMPRCPWCICYRWWFLPEIRRTWLRI
jgi:hypothetical protein